MNIPFNDPSRYVAKKTKELKLAFDRFSESRTYIMGPNIEQFEKEFSEYLGTTHCISVGNGTDALELALKSLQLPVGAGVANVGNAGMYSTCAIWAAGLVPYFVDVQETNYLPTLEDIKKAISDGCSALILTHLFGQINPEIKQIIRLCRQEGVFVVEDCAQAHGASHEGVRAGNFGDVAAFSFYPTKNLGALGDGGAVVTGNPEINKRIRSLRQYGWSQKYIVGDPGGMNSRLDELQAAFLRIFLKDLDQRNFRRREISKKYLRELRNPSIFIPEASEGEDYVAHLFCIRVGNRDSFRGHLNGEGIGTDVHYPVPDFEQSIFGSLKNNVRVDAPVTSKLAREIVSIPCYPELSDPEVHKIIEAVNSWKN